MAALNVGDRTAGRDLQEMVQEGILVAKGNTIARRYYLP